MAMDRHHEIEDEAADALRRENNPSPDHQLQRARDAIDKALTAMRAEIQKARESLQKSQTREVNYPRLRRLIHEIDPEINKEERIEQALELAVTKVHQLKQVNRELRSRLVARLAARMMSANRVVSENEDYTEHAGVVASVDLDQATKQPINLAAYDQARNEGAIAAVEAISAMIDGQYFKIPGLVTTDDHPRARELVAKVMALKETVEALKEANVKLAQESAHRAFGIKDDGITTFVTQGPNDALMLALAALSEEEKEALIKGPYSGVVAGFRPSEQSKARLHTKDQGTNATLEDAGLVGGRPFAKKWWDSTLKDFAKQVNEFNKRNVDMWLDLCRARLANAELEAENKRLKDAAVH